MQMVTSNINPGGIGALAPLAEPPSAVERPSRFERACWFVPLIGWTVAAAFEQERRAPKAEHIARQIALRTESAVAAWGDNRRRRAVARSVCDVICDLFEWPNAYFLPEDRLDLLMWTVGDGITPITCAFAIEKALGVTLGCETSNWWKMTLGQMVDQIISLPRRCRTCGYDLRASPDRCPECGARVPE